ncbi:hypothetical protein BDR07DRAFT_765239 [Suillus spraguei]|nr:hypothetical protein BDR07DRAFT_765239 [Suillus spraguei]
MFGKFLRLRYILIRIFQPTESHPIRLKKMHLRKSHFMWRLTATCVNVHCEFRMCLTSTSLLPSRIMPADGNSTAVCYLIGRHSYASATEIHRRNLERHSLGYCIRQLPTDGRWKCRIISRVNEHNLQFRLIGKIGPD